MFDEAANGNSRLTSANLPAQRYLATNRFKVREGAKAKFEKRWADRKSRLAILPGFRFFSLFKRIELPGMPPSDDPHNYISFTIWENKGNFDAWRTGDAFKEAHGGGGITDFLKLLGTALFILDGGPKPAFYDALLVKSGEKLEFATDNGWRSIVADGVNFIPADIIMTQNRFKVLEGKEVEFEQQWAARESRLEEVPGFIGFTMLRRDASKADDGYNYISSTIWRDLAAFTNWKSSDAFKAAHTAAGTQTKCYEEAPKLAVYEGKLTLMSDLGIGSGPATPLSGTGMSPSMLRPEASSTGAKVSQ